MTNRKETIRYLKTEISALESRMDEKNSLIVALRDQLQNHENKTGDERRTQIFRRAALDMVPDESQREFSNLGPVMIKDMGDAMVALGTRLDHKFAEINALNEITERVNSGMFFSEVLDHVFDNFKTLIPYDRIDVALIEQGKSGRTLVRAQWSRAEYELVLLGKGYATPLEGSSLQ
ncbi:MAG: hypothetical protein HOO00_04720, partial [Rhodospirillaceae bacterium]|nr:hypothetical protein [Rhodospirillaceae bacterium]